MTDTIFESESRKFISNNTSKSDSIIRLVVLEGTNKQDNWGDCYLKINDEYVIAASTGGCWEDDDDDFARLNKAIIDAENLRDFINDWINDIQHLKKLIRNLPEKKEEAEQ